MPVPPAGPVTWATATVGVRNPLQMPPMTLAVVIIGMLVIAAMVCAALNVLIERIAYRRLRNAPRLAPLISAIGMSFILINVGLIWKSPRQLNFPDVIPRIDILQDIFGIKVRGFRSIGKFLATRRALRAIRAFNLTHMNRGRNAYQASHCYSLADYMVADE